MQDLLTQSSTCQYLMVASRRILRALLCLLFCVQAPIVLAASLDSQAAEQAQQIADATAWTENGVQSRNSPMLLHPLGVQTLSIEVRESKDKSRLTELSVYQFHYDLAQARLLSVDVANDRLIKSHTIDSVHLPLNQAEIAYASTLLQSHSAIIQQLREEQILRGHIAFGSLSELDVKASIYEPHDPNHPCFRKRCALMSLFDDTRTVFSTEPVINLQDGLVSLLKKP